MKAAQGSRAASFLVGSLCIVGLLTPVLAHADTTPTIVSLDDTGTPFTQAYLGPRSISADGTHLLLETYASNGTPTIILRDLTGKTPELTVASGSIGALPVLSGDGNTVAYQIYTNGATVYHLYTYDALTGITTPIADSDTVFTHALDASGTHLAYAQYTNGTYSTILYDLTNQASTTIPGNDEPAAGIDLSPDARYVSMTTYDSSINRHFLQYDTQLATTTVAMGGGISDAQSSDGRFIALRGGNIVIVYDRDTKTAQTIVQDPYLQNDVSMSADGRYISYADWNSSGATIFVYDRTTQTTQLIHDDTTGNGFVLYSGPFLSPDGQSLFYGHRGVVYRRDNPLVVTGFDPSKGEYSFPNLGNTPFSTSTKEALYDEVFGTSTPLSPQALVMQAWFANPTSDQFFGGDGNCFGMALSAGKEFQGGRQMLWGLSEPTTTKVIITDSNGIRHEIPYWNGNISSLDTNPVLHRIASDQIAQVGNLSQISIDDFLKVPDPAAYIIAISGTYNEELGSHTLLPYSIDTITPGEKYVVHVYDSNYPGTGTSTITLNRASGFLNSSQTWNDSFEVDYKHGTIWADSAEKNMQIYPIANYTYDTSHKLTLQPSLMTHASTIVVQNAAGQMTGYDGTTTYNDIPDVTARVVSGIVLDATSTPTFMFQGNMAQDLQVRIASSSDDKSVGMFKMLSSGYVDASMAPTGGNLTLKADDSRVTIASTTGAYDITVGDTSEGTGRTFRLSGTSASASSTYTYDIDLASATDTAPITLKADINGDGVIDTVQHLTADGRLVDITPPAVSLAYAGTLGKNGWYVSAVKATLVATDTESGVASLSYSLDGKPTTTIATTSPVIIPISGDGMHSLVYSATDNAGNASQATTTTIKIDTAAPEAAAAFSTSTNAIQITGSDNLTATVIATTSTSAVISDQAGNTLTLRITQSTTQPNNAALAIASFAYSTGSSTNAITAVRYFWLQDRTGKYTLFVSSIRTPTTRLIAIYVPLLGKTYVVSGTASDDTADLSTQTVKLLLRPVVKMYNGMYILGISTSKGAVVIN